MFQTSSLEITGISQQILNINISMFVENTIFLSNAFTVYIKEIGNKKLFCKPFKSIHIRD